MTVQRHYGRKSQLGETINKWGQRVRMVSEGAPECNEMLCEEVCNKRRRLDKNLE